MGRYFNWYIRTSFNDFTEMNRAQLPGTLADIPELETRI